MAGTLAVALILVLASVVIGRALMLALGWRRPEWVAGAVGFAALVTVAPFAVRLPGRGLTAAILLGLATLACAVVTRRAVPSRKPGEEPPPGAPRHQHRVALAVLVVTLAAACLPFAFNERTGVLGEGIYTNDQAAQLYWADWLADGFGPQPSAVSFGYPVGPQALAASASEGTGVNLVDAFNGLLLAIPALTALAALSLLAPLAPWRRGVAAVLAGLPFLGASFLAQSGFKETAMAMLVLALAVILHLAALTSERAAPPPARASIGVVAILAAASVFTFSIPGGVWFGVAVPVWAALTWGFGQERLDLNRLRADASEHRRVLVVGAVALGALAVIALGPAGGFLDKIDEVQGSSGRLSSPVFPGEAFGIWPEGDFRIVRGEVSGSLLASGFAALCALGAAIALIRRREWGILATLLAAGFVYAVARPFAQIHVEAKALAVLAPIAMLVTVRWLLAPADGPGSIARQAVGAVFCALALASSFVALRAAPVGFDERGSEDLSELAERVDGKSVVFLGVDRFAGYWLRGTLAESPGGYVPRDVEGRPEKTWQQGLAMDFDTLSPSKLDTYEYAVTTAAAYASTPPESYTEIAREGDYVLWKRAGETPPQRVLAEEGDPGLTLDCSASQPLAAAEATTLETPVTVEYEDWPADFPLEAPDSATATLDVPAGDWQLSLQYHSQVPLTISADGEELAELPPSLEGFYLVGAGRGAFWPAGEFASGGGEVEVEVDAANPSELQDLLGVDRKTWLGKLAFTSTEAPRQAELSESCGDYVDHFTAAR